VTSARRTIFSTCGKEGAVAVAAANAATPATHSHRNQDSAEPADQAVAESTKRGREEHKLSSPIAFTLT